MNTEDLRRLDMTALLVFRHLMRHRQTVAVAQELGITQSAVSHALSRLRAVFDDPLFLRRAHGLEPTLRAQALEPPIAAAVEALEQVFLPPAPFDPDVAGPLRVVGDEASLTVVMPILTEALAAEAPRIALHPDIQDEAGILAALESGQADIGFVPWEEAPSPRFQINWLGRQSWTVVAHSSHPLFDAADRADAYRRADHITPARGLAQPSALPDAHIQAPSLLALLASLQQSHLVATLPARIATRFAPMMGLATGPCPVALPDCPIAMLRHARDRTNPMLHWVAARLAAALR